MKTHAFVRSNIPRAIQNGQAKLSQIKLKLSSCEKETKLSDAEGSSFFSRFVLLSSIAINILKNRVNESSFKIKKPIV
jgi:hypothetical protein